MNQNSATSASSAGPGRSRFLSGPKLVSAAVILIIGAVLTIVIAWASAIASTLHPSATRGGPDLQSGTSVITRADQSKSTLIVVTSSTWLVSLERISLSPWKTYRTKDSESVAPAEQLLAPWSQSRFAPMLAAAERDPSLILNHFITAYGFPFRTLRTTYSNQGQAGGGYSRATTGELPLPAGIQDYLPVGTPPVTVPIDPWWPGLAINTVFWSVITRSLLALAAAGLRHLRRHLRRKKGLCPSCAYSRSGLSAATPCPECGETPTLATPPTHR